MVVDSRTKVVISWSKAVKSNIEIEQIELRWARVEVFENNKRNERSKIGKFGVFFQLLGNFHKHKNG